MRQWLAMKMERMKNQGRSEETRQGRANEGEPRGTGDRKRTERNRHAAEEEAKKTGLVPMIRWKRGGATPKW